MMSTKQLLCCEANFPGPPLQRVPVDKAAVVCLLSHTSTITHPTIAGQTHTNTTPQKTFIFESWAVPPWEPGGQQTLQECEARQKYTESPFLLGPCLRRNELIQLYLCSVPNTCWRLISIDDCCIFLEEGADAANIFMVHL